MIHFMQQKKFTKLTINDDFIMIKTLTNLVKYHLLTPKKNQYNFTKLSPLHATKEVNKPELAKHF
jgi:hypothetical protein